MSVRSSRSFTRFHVVCVVRRFHSGLFLAALLATGVVVGCDHGPSGTSQKQAPLVSGLEVQPDSVNVADLSVEDSLAQVPLALRIRARDADGTVERVVFTIEPAGNPRGTATGTLQEQEGDVFARQLGLRVPVAVEEVYTVRVFAVDDDSLASNQALGRVQVVPES